MDKRNKQKAVMLDKELQIQVEALCKVMKTNFANKTKDLLLEWKIKELKRLKEDAPDMYSEYEKEVKLKSE